MKSGDMGGAPRVLVCRSDGPGGVAHYYRELGRYFPQRVRFFLVHDPGEKRLVAKIWKLLSRLPRFVSQVSRTDVVCLNPSLYPNSYYRDMLFLTVAKLQKRRTVVFFRGWSVPFGNRIASCAIGRKVFQLTYGGADCFIVLGDIFRKRLVAFGIREDRIHVETTVASVPHGYRVGQLPDLGKKELRLLFLSRIVDGKGWKETIDFARELGRRLPDWQVSLVMAGDGDRKMEAERYAAGFPCRFTGRVEGGEKLKLYEEAHVFILLSETEGLPNTIMEAMLFGLVVVATPVGAIPEIVENGRNGVILDSSLENAVDRLIGLMHEPGRAKGIMNLNRNTAWSKFQPQQCAERFMRIMDVAAGDLPDNTHE